MRLRWLVGLQIGALIAVGAVTVWRSHIWAPVDERAHYAYVQVVAEDGRLPRITDLVSPQVQAITDHTWPRASPTDPAAIGLAGRNYEAFQPPLYYVAAAPVFAAVADYEQKVHALRAFDLLLVAATVVLLALIARDESPAQAATALAGGLTVLLWPGVLARAITVSTLPLELLLATALVLALRRGWLLRSGGLLGACLLTKLTLVYLAVPFALVVLPRLAGERRRALAALAAPVALLAPWVVSNLVRFGTLTADAAARAQQAPLLNPTHHRYRLGDLPDRLLRLADGVLAQEWTARLTVPWIRALTVGLLVALLGGAAWWVWRRAPRTLALTVAGLVAGLAMMVATLLVADWDIFQLRYLYPILPALGLGVAAAAERRLSPVAMAGVLGVQGLALALLWVDVAGSFYFTDIGHAIGI